MDAIVTLEIRLTDRMWGISDCVFGLHATSREQAVIDLCHEDIGAMIDDAVWHVEFVNYEEEQ